MRLPLIPLLLVPPALAQAGQTGQTPFAAPAPDDSAHLIRLSFPSRDATEFAFSTLEAHGIDVWQRSARSLHLAAPPSTLTSILPFSPPALVAPVASLLAQPTIQASYNLAHSNAVVRNITADRSAVRGDEMHQSFHPYDNLVQIMQALVDEFPGYAEMVQVAESSEGRPVWGLKVTSLSCALPDECGDDLQVELEDDDDEEDEDGSDAFWRKKHKGKKGRKHKPKRPEYPHKLGFVISGTQHSREWIAASTALYSAHALLLSSSTPSARSSRLLNIFSFTFVPVVNVDGYAYTWTTDRLWRKNRQEVVGGKSECRGIDLNRNWGHRFSPGNRPNPCSDAYPGEKPFQAPELRGLADFIEEPSNHVAAFVDLHSFGQMLMFPWSYSCKKPTSDDEDLFEAAIGAAQAVRGVHGRSFEVGSVCQVSLTSPGESVDWTYADAKVRWSFAIELRGGVYGFLLPPAQILPSGEETHAGLVSLAEFVAKKEAGKKLL